jgi:hypothetical protein
MGYNLKITAELNSWQVNDEHHSAVGIIHNTRDAKEYPEGEKYSILNFKSKTHYPAFDLDPVANKEHWLIETHLGKFFILYKSQERR